MMQNYLKNTALGVVCVTTFLFYGSETALAQFYPVPATQLDMTVFYPNQENAPIQLSGFAISSLVTVAEFKTYLLEVQRDSSKAFYESQLPQLSKQPMELLTAILKDEQLQQQPMPGVSWTVARNYCRWLTAKAIKSGMNYVYELPCVSEIMAYEMWYSPVVTPLLESWTINAYDESMFTYSMPDASREYFYDAKSDDPPAMKRKNIFGGSYHMNYTTAQNTPKFKYEYQDSSSKYVGFRVVRKSSVALEKITQDFETGKVDCAIANNHLNGVYVEYYPNGLKKVVGAFYEGNRTGIWTVWNQLGTIDLQRNYTGNKGVEFLYPKMENPYETLYDRYFSTDLERNESGCYSYQHVEERAVAYSFRLWRELTPINEPELFQQVDFKQLLTLALNKEIKLYEYGKYGQFQQLVPTKDYPKLLKEMDQWDFSRIEIKEDFFFSSDLLTGDVRQLGINFYAKSTDKTPAYSLYFPQVRKELSTFPMKIEGNEIVRHLDDYFFFHMYRGSIVYYSHFWEDEEREDITKRNWELELTPIVGEHELWISFGR